MFIIYNDYHNSFKFVFNLHYIIFISNFFVTVGYIYISLVITNHPQFTDAMLKLGLGIMRDLSS